MKEILLKKLEERLKIKGLKIERGIGDGILKSGGVVVGYMILVLDEDDEETFKKIQEIPHPIYLIVPREKQKKFSEFILKKGMVGKVKIYYWEINFNL